MRCAGGGLPAEHTLTVPGELRVDSRFWEGPLAPELASPGLESFVADVVPTLCPSDLVVFCHSWEPGSAAGAAGIHEEEAIVALEKAAAAGASVRHVIVCPRGQTSAGDALLSRVRSVASIGVCVQLPHAAVLSPTSGAAEPPALLCALALKLVLNALSTGAHAAKGLVVGNVMANM